MLKVLRLRVVRRAPPERTLPGVEDDLGDLVRRFRAGDQRAIRSLLGAVGPSMLQVIRRVLGFRHADVEDTLQEATIALLHALPTFRGECTARHFGCRIAAFTAISARRRRILTGGVCFDTTDVDGQPAAASAGFQGAWGDDWALSAERRQLARRLLDDLPVPQAEALVLHFIAGLTVDELASAAGVPVETARSRLRVAKAALRARISRDPAASELLGELS